MNRAAFAALAVVAAAGLLARSAAPVAHACQPVFPGPTVDQEVASASYILTATLAERYYEPPFDPKAPDEFVHVEKVRFAGEVYLRGGGLELLFSTGSKWWFTEDGVATGVTEMCNPLYPVERGAPYVVLAASIGRENEPVSVTKAERTDLPYGEAYLQQVVAALNATPTPAPSASPTAASSPTPTPAVLPDSGGFADHMHLPIAFIGTIAISLWLLAGGSFLARRKRPDPPR